MSKSLERGKNRKAGSAGANSSALEGLEMDARRQQRLKTKEILQKGRTPLQVIEIADEANHVGEEALRKAHAIQHPPVLACHEGCDWCCYLDVGTTVPEVVRIAAYLRRHLSEEELVQVRERLVRRQAQRRERQLGRRGEPLVPCALLVDHRCSVYPVRPLTCRASNSQSAKACEQFLNQPKTELPVYGPQHRIGTFVLDGMRAGLGEAGLSGELLELSAALRVALELPDAAERWLAGEPVFAPARFD
jgi:Fe-S-cluster containining protein